MKLAALFSAAVVASAACGPRTVTPSPPPPGDRPRLVVLLVIDQLPQWAFVAKRPHLSGGFDRLLREGEWHTGQLPSSATMTAPGHALLGSGEPPAASGILSNEWWDRAAQKMVSCVDDPAGGVSASRLRVPALGDAIELQRAALKQAGAAEMLPKAVAVSLKDRAAILPLGHAGTPIWYDARRVAFTSLRPLPWLTAYTQAHPIAPLLTTVWTPLDAGKLAVLSGVADDRPGEVGEAGFGITFPHALGATKVPAEAIIAAPIGNQLVFGLALAAIDGEQLGTDSVPDLLVISLSVNDYVGHGWGQESWEAWDEMLRLDQQLGGFLAALDAKVGAGNWALIATSDHGAAPFPEPGHRISYEQVKAAANAAAVAELGPGDWISAVKYPTVWLTPAALARPARELAIATKKIIYALRSFPGIDRVERLVDLAGHCETRTGDLFVLCQMLDVERSGEIVFLPRRGWIFQKESDPYATSHGSANDYDREVPVILLPPKRSPHPPLATPSDTMVQMTRISTILARWLGVTPPVSIKR